MSKHTHWAPMDGMTLLITLATAALCMGFPILFYKSVEHHTALTKIVCVLPIVIFLFASLFAVKGYQLDNGALLIKRTLWVTYVPLEPLESAVYKPGAMAGSRILFGSLGVFGWLGTFTNITWGNYQAWVTDRGKTVVLKTAGRTLMISPLDPQKFLNALPPVKA